MCLLPALLLLRADLQLLASSLGGVCTGLETHMSTHINMWPFAQLCCGRGCRTSSRQGCGLPFLSRIIGDMEPCSQLQRPLPNLTCSWGLPFVERKLSACCRKLRGCGTCTLAEGPLRWKNVFMGLKVPCLFKYSCRCSSFCSSLENTSWSFPWLSYFWH